MTPGLLAVKYLANLARIVDSVGAGSCVHYQPVSSLAEIKPKWKTVCMFRRLLEACCRLGDVSGVAGSG